MNDSFNLEKPGVSDQKVVAPVMINNYISTKKKATKDCSADEETHSTSRKVKNQEEKKQSSGNACCYLLPIGIIVAIFVITFAAIFAYKYMTPPETIYVEGHVEPQPHPSLKEAVRMEHLYNELIVMDLPARNQKFPTKKELERLT